MTKLLQAMAFTWKDNGKIFVGEGIYHLTFVVAGRRPLPHDSTRWRMIAGNVMLEMIGEGE